MKRLIYISLLAAAVVACSKTEVAYDESAASEISISPVAGNITKAAVTDGTYPTDQHIGIFSYHNTDLVSGSTNFTEAQIAKFAANPYFTDAEFYYNDEAKTAWGGLTPYYWPITGSLVFAGYSMPAADAANQSQPVTKNGTATYDLTNDKLTITGYKAGTETDKTHDLLWFGRTSTSYNNRTTGAAISINFSHALSWITFQVKGDAVTTDSDNPWKITSVVLNDVAYEGKAECVGGTSPVATWKDLGPKNQDGEIQGTDMTIFAGVVNYDATEDTAQELTFITENGSTAYPATDIETVPGGTLVIPQTPTTATISVTYKAPAGTVINETFNVPLNLSDDAKWESGKHYTYVISFTANEIKVAPIVNTWPDAISTNK